MNKLIPGMRSGAFLLLGFFFGTIQSQTFPTVNLPRPDSAGWIKIFRGNNLSDFSLYTGNGTPAQEGTRAFGDPFYHQGGDTIRTDGSPFGQLIFKQNFSHYIMSVQLRWPSGLGNCGIMTKIQWNDVGQGGGLPTSVECQGDPNQGMGQVWALGPGSARPWITFRGRTDPRGAIVDSTNPVMDFGGSGGQNCIVGFPGWQQPRPAALNNGGWVTITAENHGRDTARHFVDGQKVMQYWNPRIAQPTNANQVVKYLTEGMLSIQSEGPTVWYRNWRIMLLPQDPLYASLYTTWIHNYSIQPKVFVRTHLSFQGGALAIATDLKGFRSLTGRRLRVLPLDPR